MEEVINELMKMSLRYCFRLLVQMNYLVMRRGLCFFIYKAYSPPADVHVCLRGWKKSLVLVQNGNPRIQ